MYLLEKSKHIVFCALVLVLCAALNFAIANDQPQKAKGKAGAGKIQKRTYDFKEAGKQMGYAMFVPSKYDKDKKTPLIIALHGLGGSPEQLLGYSGFTELAEKFGYILAAPMGYNPSGWYGNKPPSKGKTEPANLGELSEKDVMNVLAIVRKDFNIDDNRIYLMGHSMGGGGTWHIGIKYPDIWAGLAPIAPAIYVSPDGLTKIKNIPVIVVQGDKDNLVPVAGARKWVAKMKELKMTHEYVEYAGGGHVDVASRGLPKIFDFFNKYQKPGKTAPVGKFSFVPGKAAPGYTQVAPTTTYGKERGFGFDCGSTVTAVERGGDDPLRSGFCTSDKPLYFSMDLPEGNYDVTVTLGDLKGDGLATVRAESRRLLLENVKTAAGKFETLTFTTNIRNSKLKSGGKVTLKDREQKGPLSSPVLHWDDKLTIELRGQKPCLCALEIVKNDSAVTVYLAGDSTVTDQTQTNETFTSWGQMLPRFFKPHVVSIANHAESGEATTSFIGAKRLEKITDTLKKGDYLLIQFGHNDQNAMRDIPTYKKTLQRYLAEARKREAIPILVTPMRRRTFDTAGKSTNTLGDFPDAVRQLAKEEKVMLIDLNLWSKDFYEALGPKDSPIAFAPMDNTHHNLYGAYEFARYIADVIKRSDLALAKHVVDDLPAANFKGPAKKQNVNRVLLTAVNQQKKGPYVHPPLNFGKVDPQAKGDMPKNLVPKAPDEVINLMRFSRLVNVTLDDRGKLVATFLNMLSNQKQLVMPSPGLKTISLVQSAQGQPIIQGILLKIEKKDLIFRLVLKAYDSSSGGKWWRYPDNDVYYTLHPDDFKLLSSSRKVNPNDKDLLYLLPQSYWEALTKKGKAVIEVGKDGKSFKHLGIGAGGLIVYVDREVVIARFDAAPPKDKIASPSFSVERVYPDARTIYRISPKHFADMLAAIQAAKEVKGTVAKEGEEERIFVMHTTYWDALAWNNILTTDAKTNTFSFYKDTVCGDILFRTDEMVIFRPFEKYCKFTGDQARGIKERFHEGICVLHVDQFVQDALQQPLPENRIKEFIK